MENEKILVEEETMEKENTDSINEEERELTDEEINIIKEEMIKEIEESEKLAKEMREDAEITEEEYKEYEKKIDERISKLSDEKYNQIIDNIFDNIDVPKDKKAFYKQEFVKRLKKEDAILEEYEESKKEYERIMQESQDELDELLLNMEYKELIKKIELLIKSAEEHHNENALNHYKRLYKEINSMLTLDNMKENVKKIKNPSKLFTMADSNYDSEYAKFYDKLGKNQNYRFVDPSRLRESLEEYLPEEKKEYAKYFLYSLFRFINTKASKIDDNAVFLEGIFRNIYSLNIPEEVVEEKENKEEDVLDFSKALEVGKPKRRTMPKEEKEIFINSIYEYVDSMR